MIGLPSTGEGANISTGLGQGAAQVLDTSSFDPIAFLTNLNKEREKKNLEKQKKQLDLNAKWAKIGTPDVKYVTDYNKKELDEKVTQYGKFITEAMTKGVDPDTDVELQRELQRQQMGILEVEQASKAIDNVLAMYQKEAKNYPPEQYQSWLEGLNQQPTVQDRLNYVQSNQPFEELIDPVKLLGEIIDPEVLQEEINTYLGNGVKQTETKYDINRLKNILEVSLYNNSAKKPLIEAFYRQNKYNTPEEMEAQLFEIAKTFLPKETTDKTVPWKETSGGGLNFNFGSGNPQAGAAMIVAGGQKQAVNEYGTATDRNFKAEHLPSLGKSLDGIKKIMKTVLKGDDIGAGVFNIVYDENKQLQNGNFLTVEGSSLTGRPNALQFTQEGSLWAVLGDKIVPIKVNTEIIKDKDVVAHAKANYEALRASFGADVASFNELIKDAYAMKDKKMNEASTQQESMNISEAEFRKMTVTERQKFKANGGKVDGK